jgi:hypothetical protein
LATRVRESLQGGAAAILPPEHRVRMTELGRRLGLRAFDVNLIIAIVQDHARCGAGESPAEMTAKLALIPGTAQALERRETDARTWWAAWIAATMVLASVFLVAAIVWLEA